jgi:branched-chain amino acid aminotransferase
MVEKLNVVWMDGRLVKWDDAKVSIFTHSLHYGLGAFEGIRAYATESGQAVFRLKEHIRRLFDSAHIAGLTIPFDFDTICNACKETLVANNLREGYIRPLVYIGEGVMGVYPADNPVRVAIATWKWGKYLGDEALEKGIRAKVSSFTRYHPNSMMTRGKFTGNYTASVLAKKEAKQLGYDEAILLDPEGFVAEGSGENIFIVRDGKIKTTPLSVILSGITRDSVLTIARDLGYEVAEQKFSRDEMYIADEVFFTGTAAEVTPIREIDNRSIGAGRPGPITRKIQQTYFDAIRGKAKAYASWLDPFELKSGTSHPETKNGKKASKPPKKAKV